MPKEKNGKHPMTVIDVRRNKKRQIVAVFTDGEIILSENAFSSFPLYKGKVVTSDEMTRLGEFLSNEKLYNYGISLASRRFYSVNEMRDKLKIKCDDEKKIDNALFYLSNIGLLNDAEYAENYAQEQSNKLYGKRKIIDKLLYEKRISKHYVDILEFPNEKEKAAKATEAKLRSLESTPIKQKRMKISVYLENRGFEKDVINDVLSSLKENPKEVRRKLLEEANKAKKRYSKKYEDYELRQKIYSYLLNKGYRNNDIIDAIERI